MELDESHGRYKLPKTLSVLEDDMQEDGGRPGFPVGPSSKFAFPLERPEETHNYPS